MLQKMLYRKTNKKIKTSKKSLHFSLGLIAMLCVAMPVFAQSTDAELDAMFLNDSKNNEMDDTALTSANVAKWDFFGYVESENFFAISGKTAVKNKELAKTEMRTRLNASYGTAFFYGKATVDVYFYPVDAKFMNPYANTIAQVEAKEMYVGGGEKFQFKLGKVDYDWGTADIFRTTNFMSKLDSSEFLAKEDDERYTGVYSMQLKYLFGDYSVELVATPDFLVPVTPKQDGFWGMQFANQDVQLGSLPTIYSWAVETSIPSRFSQFSYKNFSAAFRIGGSAKGVDFHFSYFNGFHNSLVLVPKVNITKAPTAPYYNNAEGTIVLEPLYERINKIGFDMAAAYKRFSVRFETVLTPDYVAVHSDEKDVDSNYRRNTTRVPYWAFNIGPDITFHGTSGRIFLEYTTGFFLKNHKKYEKELLSDFLVVGIEDRVAAEKLLLRAAVIVHTTDKKPGVMPLAHIEYNFDNGLSLAMGVQFFIGQNDELMTLYEASDIFYFKARYNF